MTFDLIISIRCSLKYLVVLASTLMISCTGNNPEGDYISWVENTSIVLDTDNTFKIRMWSKDGLEQCRAFGQWTFNPDTNILTTKVNRRENLSEELTDEECVRKVAETETWKVRW